MKALKLNDWIDLKAFWAQSYFKNSKSSETIFNKKTVQTIYSNQRHDKKWMK